MLSFNNVFHDIREFVSEFIHALQEKGIKSVFFGTRSHLTLEEKRIFETIIANPHTFRGGYFKKLDFVHKGRGQIFLFPLQEGLQSMLLFSEDTSIRNGPQLVVYLSTASNPKQKGIGKIIDLGPLKATQGGQAYIIEKTLSELQQFNSVVVWCKPFKVLFTYAVLKQSS